MNGKGRRNSGVYSNRGLNLILYSKWDSNAIFWNAGNKMQSLTQIESCSLCLLDQNKDYRKRILLF